MSDPDDPLTAKTGLTRSERSARGKLAINTRWAKTRDRTAATAKMRQVFQDRFEKQVDPEGTLDPEVRAKLAQNARQAFYQSMALKSAKARRLRKEAREAAARDAADGNRAAS